MKIAVLVSVLFHSLSALTPQIQSDGFHQLNPDPLNIVLSSSFGGRSHIKYLLEMATVLRDRGHSITIATLDNNFRFNKPYNYTEYSVGDMNLDTSVWTKSTGLDKIIENPIPFMLNFLSKVLIESYEVTFEKFEQLFRTQKVDLIICDFFNAPCSDAARKHAVPLVIGFQSLAFGVGTAPFITETTDNSHTSTDHYSFFERFKLSVIDPIIQLYQFLPLSKAVNQVRSKYGVPYNPNPFGEYNQVLKISNTFIGFEDPRPIESTLKLIGPVLDEKKTPLTQELDEFLNVNPKTMYVAFGSHVALTNKMLESLLGAIQLAINDGTLDSVLWGLASTHLDDFPKSFQVDSRTYITKSILDGTHPNIKIVSWAPQVAVLDHPNTKLFLSHGGLESIFEGIHSGTPILCMPVFGDQPRNGRLLKNRGIGDFVETKNTNAHDLYNKIKELTRDDNTQLQTRVKHIQSISHANNANRESNALFLENYAESARLCRQTRPAKPFEVPCEFEPYMSVDKKMPFIKAYKIDILFTIAGLAVVFNVIGIYIIFFLFKAYIFNQSLSKNKTD